MVEALKSVKEKIERREDEFSKKIKDCSATADKVKRCMDKLKELLGTLCKSLDKSSKKCIKEALKEYDWENLKSKLDEIDAKSDSGLKKNIEKANTNLDRIMNKNEKLKNDFKEIQKIMQNEIDLIEYIDKSLQYYSEKCYRKMYENISKFAEIYQESTVMNVKEYAKLLSRYEIMKENLKNRVIARPRSNNNGIRYRSLVNGKVIKNDYWTIRPCKKDINGYDDKSLCDLKGEEKHINVYSADDCSAMEVECPDWFRSTEAHGGFEIGFVWPDPNTRIFDKALYSVADKLKVDELPTSSTHLLGGLDIKPIKVNKNSTMPSEASREDEPSVTAPGFTPPSVHVTAPPPVPPMLTPPVTPPIAPSPTSPTSILNAPKAPTQERAMKIPNPPPGFASPATESPSSS